MVETEKEEIVFEVGGIFEAIPPSDSSGYNTSVVGSIGVAEG